MLRRTRKERPPPPAGRGVVCSGLLLLAFAVGGLGLVRQFGEPARASRTDRGGRLIVADERPLMSDRVIRAGDVVSDRKPTAPAPAPSACPADACALLERAYRPVVFFHVSKAAGTSVCLMALANGERVKTDKAHPEYLNGRCTEGYGAYERETQRPGRCHNNCHAPDVGKAAPLCAGTPEEQAAAAARYFGPEHDLTFVAPEFQVSPHGFAGRELGVFGFTVLRAPQERLVSQYHQKMVNPKLFADEWEKWFGARLDHPPSLEEFLGWMRQSRNDNYHVRYYLGLRHVDRAVTAQDLAAAKAVLRDQMNFVLTTERLGEAGCLLDKIGWKPAVATSRPSEATSEEKQRETGAPAVAALLDELTEFDRPLYEYAVELFEEQLARCACCKRREAGRAGAG